MSDADWPLVSVVVTGYKRPHELKRTVESLLATVRYAPLELILADDASPEELRAPMRELPFDRFVFADRNRGLGANTNSGLEAARGDFVLQLQDDWHCTGPPDFLERGVALLQGELSIGLLRYTRRFGPGDDLPPHRTLENDPAVRVFPTDPTRDAYLYSDQPHLKSRAFIDAIGPYKVSRYMQATEIDMRHRFNAQTRFEAAFIEGYEAFDHIGEEVSHRRPMPAARIGALMDRTPGLRSIAGWLRAARG